MVTFSDDYYKSLIEHAVPQDVRAMYALKGSALAMDDTRCSPSACTGSRAAR